MQFTIESGVPDIEEGTYDATLKAITEKEVDSPEGVREFLAWDFDVVIEGETVEVGGASSKTFSPKSKSFEWMTNILNRTLKVGESIDVEDDLVGKPCRVLIGKNSQGYPKVEKVLAPSRKAGAAPKEDLPF